jgi:hypothetical protein
VIHADASSISKAIVDVPALLRALHDFIGAVIGDDDLGSILEVLPEMIAAHSPFTDEGALIEAVRAETLQALHTLALSRLPARGSA